MRTPPHPGALPPPQPPPPRPPPWRPSSRVAPSGAAGPTRRTSGGCKTSRRILPLQRSRPEVQGFRVLGHLSLSPTCGAAPHAPPPPLLTASVG